MCLLGGCADWRIKPLAIPKEANVSCYGDVCCYSYTKTTMMCVSSDVAHSVVFYVQVIEK